MRIDERRLGDESKGVNAAALPLLGEKCRLRVADRFGIEIDVLLLPVARVHAQPVSR